MAISAGEEQYLHSKIEELRSRIRELEESTANSKAFEEDESEDLDELRGDYDSVGERISALSGSYASPEDRLNDLAGDFDTPEDRINSLSEDYDTPEYRIEDMQSRIDNLENDAEDSDSLKERNGDLWNALDQANTLLKRISDLLNDIQWSGEVVDDDRVCPSCECASNEGHDGDCRLYGTISEIEDITSVIDDIL